MRLLLYVFATQMVLSKRTNECTTRYEYDEEEHIVNIYKAF